LIVWGKEEKEFLRNLETLFQRLLERDITLNPEKARLALQEIEYVGHVINSQGLTMSREKIQKVLDFPLPTVGKQLKSFLGLANYFRDHVPNASTLAQPLHQMLEDYASKRRAVLVWSEETKQAFATLKCRIEECPTLYFMDDQSPVYLATDASDYGVGAHLYQMVGEQRRTVALVSQSLSKVQQRWSTIEKECYAIYYALKELQYLLSDVFFTIRTDHKNLLYLNDCNPKVVRWKLAIQEFNFRVQHIAGPENVAADALSRLVEKVPLEDGINMQVDDYSSPSLVAAMTEETPLVSQAERSTGN